LRRDQQILSWTKNRKSGKTVVRRDKQILSRKKNWEIWKNSSEERSTNTSPDKK
jgi:hypothetical protein